MYAVRITQGIHYSPYVAAAWGRETMFFYIVAGFQEFMGPTKIALQTAGVAIGIATLGAMYIFCRRLFDSWTALIATFLLGISGWHLTLSKVGWREIRCRCSSRSSSISSKAVDERKLRDFAIAGFLLGLSLDTYDARESSRSRQACSSCTRSFAIGGSSRRTILHLITFGVCAFIAFSAARLVRSSPPPAGIHRPRPLPGGSGAQIACR